MEFVYFGSGTKLKELSNLYECELNYNGNVYCSVEHIYQSLKFIEEDRHRFMISGDLGSYDGLMKYKSVFYPKKWSEEDVTKKISYWKERNCVGIIAKLSSNPKNSDKLGLTFIGMNKSDAEKTRLFIEILQLKFENEFFKDVLKKTSGLELIEFGKSCKRNFDKGIQEKWCGLVQDGVVYGKNIMGKIMMKVRDQL